MFKFNMKNWFAKKSGIGFWRRCHIKLCSNVWWIFAWAAVALFMYVLFCPNTFLMLILFLLVCGLIFWLRI
ncbi:MAG: hypothetical protein ACOX7J_09455 [Bacillota bacterium]